MPDTSLSLDPLETGGYPVHCRTLMVDLREDEAGCVRAQATILDVRKQGWIPTGGELQTAGVIHHMSLDALVERASGRIARFEPSQHVVAFEPDVRTAGESCRDPIHLLRGMVGETLTAGSARRLRELFGGPLGCSHLLTLAQLLVSFVPVAIAHELQRTAASGHDRERGERIAKRSLVIDGFERRDGDLEIAIQLTDIHTLPFASVKGMLDRFGAQHELRAIIRVDAAAMTIGAFDVAERLRTRAGLGSAAWQSRREELAWLGGRPVMHGLAPELLRRYGADAAREPLLAALLNFAPGYVQSLSTRVTRMIEQQARSGGHPGNIEMSGIGGFPDSCYMWRAGGHMMQMRKARGQVGD